MLNRSEGKTLEKSLRKYFSKNLVSMSLTNVKLKIVKDSIAEISATYILNKPINFIWIDFTIPPDLTISAQDKKDESNI